MTSRSPSRFRSERWFALLLVIAILILSLFQLVCLIASYFPPDPYGLQRHEYGVFLPLLGGLLFSIYLLRTTREELRRPLPIAALTGLVLGLFLGCISNLPYYLLLLLAFGIFGPFMALTSADPTATAQAYRWPDFWLSTLAVLLSLLLYALVAYLVARRTGQLRQGVWSALLAAFITLLVATYTFVIMLLIQAFPSPLQEVLPRIIFFQDLPLNTLLLSIAQVTHAAFASLIGSSIALRRLNRRGLNAESP